MDDAKPAMRGGLGTELGGDEARGGALRVGVHVDISGDLAVLVAQLAGGDTGALARAKAVLDGLHRKAEQDRLEQEQVDAARRREVVGQDVVDIDAAREVLPRRGRGR
jgi:hypothetical protein